MRYIHSPADEDECDERKMEGEWEGENDEKTREKKLNNASIKYLLMVV